MVRDAPIADPSSDESSNAFAALPQFSIHRLGIFASGVTSQSLDSRFANPAAYGDLIAAILALLAILALHRGWHRDHSYHAP